MAPLHRPRANKKKESTHAHKKKQQAAGKVAANCVLCLCLLHRTALALGGGGGGGVGGAGILNLAFMTCPDGVPTVWFGLAGGSLLSNKAALHICGCIFFLLRFVIQPTWISPARQWKPVRRGPSVLTTSRGGWLHCASGLLQLKVQCVKSFSSLTAPFHI